ncbi:magnesium transporter protein [Dioscorea alata]|uniref:Magnesium transporter protein n=4 Tax=Dioscorea alata TaxID=55571 RepID=A0ACB7VHB2_DIOAL|nr:magnesium transporter protein [Dioscorea alata]KAH7673406.1 magnesium transporter protein [Dioscorea alata]KAH7673407.1 magnesium transporter protein [Dioscorea alata]KAH7673409.1 magnesium transporter protein [Dioscorea alata]
MKDQNSTQLLSGIHRRVSFQEGAELDGVGIPLLHGFGTSGVKKRGIGSRSWVQIDKNGKSQTLVLDKATLLKRCGLPARDLRLLDPLFVYPSTILGREKAIVVSLEKVRCIIMADDVFLLKSIDSCVLQYESELCQRLQTVKDQNDDLPFEFKALELALELASSSLDSQVTGLELEIYPVLEELASSISTVNLEHVRRLKSDLLALTHRVQKVRDEIEQLMDDDGDMAEMYLTEKKARMETYFATEQYVNNLSTEDAVSRSLPCSPTGSSIGESGKAWSSAIMSLSKHDSSASHSSSNRRWNVEELEMLLEAYFVVMDYTLSKLLSLKEYIDDTEDFINIKLNNVQNQLIQFELLLTAATFFVTIFAVVTGVFGMNFVDSVFDNPSNFDSVVIYSTICCAVAYLFFLLYFKHKRLLPL